MTKTEFIAAVANSAGTSKSDTEKIVNAFLETITSALKNGES